jgi:exosortase A
MSAVIARTPPTQSDGGRGWGLALGLLVALLAIVLAGYWPTARSMVDTWLRSETFTHGFLIAPIALWLAWHRRRHLQALEPAASWPGVAAFALAACVWLAGDVADVLVVAQFGLIAMIVAVVWAVLGDLAFRQLLFPLAFLFFAVPVGEALVPPLMEFTATFTVGLLRLTGIPVYREGLYFSVPSGNWSVVEACSGVRYLIASVTLGVLYAYLAYRGAMKRVLFVLAAALVPILANGLRAYMIVMIGHLSDMRLATGVDHLIYGWVFFGVVMLILFSVGARWRDPEDSDPEPPPRLGRAGPRPGAGSVIAAVVMLGLGLGTRAIAARIDAHTSPLLSPASLPPAVGGWSQGVRRPWTWAPASLPADLTLGTAYTRGDLSVTLDVSHYVRQRQGAEAVSSQNLVVAPSEPPWRVVARGTEQLAAGPEALVVESYRLSGPQSLAVWRWYRIGDRYTANPYLAKLYQALNRLHFGRTDGAIIALAAPLDAHGEPPMDAVRDFVGAMLPALAEALDVSVGER